VTEPLPDQLAKPEQQPAPGKPWYRKITVLAAAGVLAAAIAVGALFGAGAFSSSSPITAHGTEVVFANPLNGQNVQEAYPDAEASAFSMAFSMDLVNAL
jgi:hypothetical protein